MITTREFFESDADNIILDLETKCMSILVYRTSC